MDETFYFRLYSLSYKTLKKKSAKSEHISLIGLELELCKKMQYGWNIINHF